jgi:hypothetical protein
VAHALERLGAARSPTLVVAADGFTQEAAELLAEAGAVIVARDTMDGSDESLHAVRVLVGSRVKGPDHR